MIVYLYHLFFSVNLSAGVYDSGIQSQLQFKALAIDNGLSNNYVCSITQDSIGYIWLATENGLNKFDGYTITHYKHIPDDSTSILSNYVKVLFLDSQNSLWIGNE